jgi:hypothetical protein
MQLDEVLDVLGLARSRVRVALARALSRQGAQD